MAPNCGVCLAQVQMVAKQLGTQGKLDELLKLLAAARVRMRSQSCTRQCAQPDDVHPRPQPMTMAYRLRASKSSHTWHLPPCPQVYGCWSVTEHARAPLQKLGIRMTPTMAYTTALTAIQVSAASGFACRQPRAACMT